MWPTFTWEDVRAAAHHLGMLLIIVSATMVIPLAVALLNREFGPALDYFLSCATGVFLGALMRLARIRPGALSGKQAALITGFAWVFLSLVGAVPLYLSGHFGSFLDAMFDAVSGFTTTGAALIQDVDHLAYSHNMWRLMTHVIGGQGIIAVALTLGVFARTSGASSLYKAEGKDGDLLPSVISTVRFSAVITAVFVAAGTAIIGAICFEQGIAGGRSLFHGLSLSAAAFGTGGFAPMSTGVLYYHSFPLEFILMIIMTAGAMNFALYLRIMKGDLSELRRNDEFRAWIVWSIVMVGLLALSLARDPVFSEAVIIGRRGVFTAVAALSNSGFSMFYPDQLSDVMSRASLFILILAMSVGGSTGSTSGGIKAMRLVVIVKTIVGDIRRAIAPDTAVIRSRYHHITEQTVTSDLSTSAMTIFLMFAITYLVGGMVGVALGYPPITAIFESVAVTSNAGLTSGIISPDMPVLLKVVYMLQMWAGRIEFLALLALIGGAVATFVPESVKRKVARDAHA